MGLLSSMLGLFLTAMNGESAISDDFTPLQLYGKWKVETWIGGQPRNSGITPQEYSEAMAYYYKCLESTAIIDSNGLHFYGNGCGYEQYYDCGLRLNAGTPMYKKQVVPDNEYTLSTDGNEMMDSTIVGKQFVHRLNRNYKSDTLLVIDTGCSSSIGNNHFLLCILDLNHLGLFSGEDVVVLRKEQSR